MTLPFENQRRQWTFLHTVERVAPHVIDALRGRPFYTYRIAAAGNGGPFYTPNLEHVVGNYPAIRRRVFSVPFERWADQFSALDLSFINYYGALYNWQVSYNLFEHWIARVADMTLYAWSQYDGHKGFARPAYSVDLPSVTIKLGAWDYGMESRSEAKARMEEEAADMIRKHLNALAADHAAHGWLKPATRKKSAFDFVEWLVRYQCNEEKQTDIAKRANAEGDSVTPNYVSRMINKTAREIGLELRPGGGQRTYLGRASK